MFKTKIITKKLETGIVVTQKKKNGTIQIEVPSPEVTPFTFRSKEVERQYEESEITHGINRLASDEAARINYFSLN